MAALLYTKQLIFFIFVVAIAVIFLYFNKVLERTFHLDTNFGVLQIRVTKRPNENGLVVNGSNSKELPLTSLPFNNSIQEPFFCDWQAMKNESRINKKDNRNFNFSCIAQIINSPWKKNTYLLEKFRYELEKKCNTKTMFAVTQKNTKSSSRLKLSFMNRMSLPISSSVYKKLPKTLPFLKLSYQSCSLVGSSGVLSNSFCGKAIDNSEFVFRCNVPPIMKHISDAGAKTNLTTINPTIIQKRYHGLTKRSDRNRFNINLSSHGQFVWIPAFTYSGNAILGYRALDAHKNNMNPQILLGHPSHQRGVQAFWLEYFGMTKPLSTGMYLLSSAISICDEIHLFGYWPFDTDEAGRNISYHYYDNIQMTSVHSFLEEFYVLLQLHRDGILKFHQGTC